jgi:hypothetical protein
MNYETMLSLTKSSYLSEQLQIKLWNSGDKVIKRALSKRRDLARELSKLACKDPDLIGSWASVARNNRSQLSMAIRYAKDDMSLISLMDQDLSEKQVILLAKKCNNILGWFLYERKKQIIPDEIRVFLIKNYISQHEYTQDYPGKIFIETLGDDIIAWKALIDSVNNRTIPFLNASSGLYKIDEEISDLVLDKTDELVNENNLSDRAYKSLERLLSDYSKILSKNDSFYQKIIDIAIKSNHFKVNELKDNISISRELSKSFCNNVYKSCKKKSCIKQLRKISKYPGFIDNSNKDFPFALLNHYKDLGSIESRKLFSDLRNDNIKICLEGLIDKKLYNKAAKLIVSTDGYIDERLLNKDIYIEIFKINPEKGMKLLKNNEYISTLIYYVKPLKLIINYENFLGYFLNDINDLNSEYYTLLNLLDQWEGDYNELLKGAKLL